MIAMSAGAAIGGLIHRPLVLILAFTAINLVAAATTARAVWPSAMGAG